MSPLLAVGRHAPQQRRRARFEPLEDRYMLSHPAVAAVNVAGTAWSAAFVSYLESSGLGTGGYAIPVGTSYQLQNLPWTNINQVRIRFTEDVVIAAADLSISGVNQAAYSFSAFNYDSATHTATWTLTAPIAKDKLMLDLDADGMAPVRSVSTGEVLDGAWTDCQSTYPSGNTQGGTDFQFRFNVLPGDINGNNFTNTSDVANVYGRIGQNLGDQSYLIRADVDGSGEITSVDYSAVCALNPSSIPSGNPVGMSDDAPTTGGISDVSAATNSADYLLSLPDFFADNETASDLLAYSVAQNTNSALFDSLNIDSSGELDLSFASNATGNASITIRATDASGLIVDTTFGVHVSDVPYVYDFRIQSGDYGYWTLEGSVGDNDDALAGDVVTFGGALASYDLSATVDASGSFSLNVQLPGLQSGYATVQAQDPHGVLSTPVQQWIDA